jgi:hypothetical protein
MSNFRQKAAVWATRPTLAASNCEWSPSNGCHLAREWLAPNKCRPLTKRCALYLICDAQRQAPIPPEFQGNDQNLWMTLGEPARGGEIVRDMQYSGLLDIMSLIGTKSMRVAC